MWIKKKHLHIGNHTKALTEYTERGNKVSDFHSLT